MAGRWDTGRVVSFVAVRKKTMCLYSCYTEAGVKRISASIPFMCGLKTKKWMNLQNIGSIIANFHSSHGWH
jgi:hypothetical protein